MSRKPKIKIAGVKLQEGRPPAATTPIANMPAPAFVPAYRHSADHQPTESITRTQAPTLLRHFYTVVFILYVALRDLAKLPADKSPKSARRSQLDRRSHDSWNASHPAWDSSLDEGRLRDRFIEMSKASDAAWRAVDLLADILDEGDRSARRWSVATKLAILNAMPFGTSDIPRAFEVMCKLVRLHPADTLGSLRRRIETLNDAVTTAELLLFEPTSICELIQRLAPKLGDWTSSPLPLSELAKCAGCNRRKTREYFAETGIEKKPGGFIVRLDTLGKALRKRIEASIIQH
jgi:hypothetical protein